MVKRRVNFLIDEAELKSLKALSGITRVKMSDYFREGIGLVLAEYQEELKKSRKERR